MSDQNIIQEEEQNKVPGTSDDQASTFSKKPNVLPPDSDVLIPSSTNEQTNLPMEVHHHGHVHEKKKWKEYLFQFLMLFLAVTLGFFVENQREHYVEHKRAKEFAKLLVDDLIIDTTELKKDLFLWLLVCLAMECNIPRRHITAIKKLWIYAVFW